MRDLSNKFWDVVRKCIGNKIPHESGSILLQIDDENLHLCRACRIDEVQSFSATELIKLGSQAIFAPGSELATRSLNAERIRLFDTDFIIDLLLVKNIRAFKAVILKGDLAWFRQGAVLAIE